MKKLRVEPLLSIEVSPLPLPSLGIPRGPEPHVIPEHMAHDCMQMVPEYLHCQRLQNASLGSLFPCTVTHIAKNFLCISFCHCLLSYYPTAVSRAWCYPLDTLHSDTYRH